jgi:hypothetical protein
MFILSFSRGDLWDSHLVELDAILLIVRFPAFGKVDALVINGKWSKSELTAYR